MRGFLTFLIFAVTNSLHVIKTARLKKEKKEKLSYERIRANLFVWYQGLSRKG